MATSVKIIALYDELEIIGTQIGEIAIAGYSIQKMSRELQPLITRMVAIYAQLNRFRKVTA